MCIDTAILRWFAARGLQPRSPRQTGGGRDPRTPVRPRGRRIVAPAAPVTQSLRSHKGSGHTKPPVTQRRRSHKASGHTKPPVTQSLRSHKGVGHTKAPVTQRLRSHKGVGHTKASVGPAGRSRGLAAAGGAVRETNRMAGTYLTLVSEGLASPRQADQRVPHRLIKYWLDMGLLQSHDIP